MIKYPFFTLALTAAAIAGTESTRGFQRVNQYRPNIGGSGSRRARPKHRGGHRSQGRN